MNRNMWNRPKGLVGVSMMAFLLVAGSLQGTRIPTSVYLPAVLAVEGSPITPPACFSWHGQIPLQEALDIHLCVVMDVGIWVTQKQINLRPGHQLYGRGMEQTKLQATDPWLGNEHDDEQYREGVVHNNGSSDVLLSGFTVDANNLSTFGVASGGITLSDMRIVNAKCDGVAISEANMVIEDSTIAFNGGNCDVSGVIGSGIYVVKPDDQNSVALLRPIIRSNTIYGNWGPALDVDRVAGGQFTVNSVFDNYGWAAVSVLSGGEWLIADNEILHADPDMIDRMHPGHPHCTPAAEEPHAAAIAICEDAQGDEPDKAVANQVRNNIVDAWYGILLMGEDDGAVSRVPMNNRVEDNDAVNTSVGCIDDFEAGVPLSNVWANNLCNSSGSAEPLYIGQHCQILISRATLDQWAIGEVDEIAVQERIDAFNDIRHDVLEQWGFWYGDYEAGTPLYVNSIIATNFFAAGYHWTDFPVAPIVHNGDWGLFEALGFFDAPYQGACMTVFR